MRRVFWTLGVIALAASATGSDAMSIVVTPDAGLSANPAAVAAFNRAAQTWAGKFSNNITVNIAGGLSGSLPSGVIANASSVHLAAPYDFFLGKIKASAASEPDDGIVAFLPTRAQISVALPSGISFTGNFSATKANFKALGYMDLIDLDARHGPTDATIVFSSNIAYDYDRSNGITPGRIDFETVASHEIGHALGFVSAVDTVDYLLNTGQTGSVSITPLDLFRFRDAVAGADPSSPAEFTSFPRFLGTGGNAIFDDLAIEIPMSTGEHTGDGHEASHWKDDTLYGALLGVMDPSLTGGVTELISNADLRALDLIGYRVSPRYVVPEPGAAMVAIAATGIALRRLRKCRSSRP